MSDPTLSDNDLKKMAWVWTTLNDLSSLSDWSREKFENILKTSYSKKSGNQRNCLNERPTDYYLAMRPIPKTNLLKLHQPIKNQIKSQPKNHLRNQRRFHEQMIKMIEHQQHSIELWLTDSSTLKRKQKNKNRDPGTVSRPSSFDLSGHPPSRDQNCKSTSGNH